MTPKRKKSKLESIDELVEEIESAESEVKAAINDEPEVEDINKKREELIQLAEDGDLDKSVKYIKRASNKVIELYTAYERKRMQKAKDFLTDLLISNQTFKFSSVFGGLDAVEDPEDLSKELKSDDLLKHDEYTLVEQINPIIPFLGILSGGITTAKHIIQPQN